MAESLPKPGPVPGAVPESSFRGRFLSQLDQMGPANFAMVMSTGIVAVGLAGHGLQTLAICLSLFCILLWLVNLILLAARILLYPGSVLRDLSLPARSCGFLTLVAGTNVLGNACVLVLENASAACGLFWFATLLWPCLVCLLWFSLCVTPQKQTPEKGLNGAWLLFTVSTQSVVVLFTLVWGTQAEAPAALLMFILFLLGEGLYFLIMPIILYRLMFKDLAPADLSATYWINAGAMAITCLAGARLVPVLSAIPGLDAFASLAAALSAGAWGIASFWIPALVLLGLWRHLAGKFPVRYGVEYWSMVFPLGMYSVCTQALFGLFPFSSFALVSDIFLFVALGVWCFVVAGLGRFLWNKVLRGKE